MLAKVHSAQLIGLKAEIIDVEVDISKGLHSFTIVGLPDKSVEEAKDRINAAIKNSDFASPQRGNKKVVVSLAPADIRKEGSAFDLAIALASLLAMAEIDFDPTGRLFLGELALDGSLRPIKGALLLADKAKKAGFTELFLPKANTTEAALIHGITIYGVGHLREVADHLVKPSEFLLKSVSPTKIESNSKKHFSVDLADIKSQATAKRGLEIAAAGGHNIALFGPPGTGKTMLAKALQTILPPLAFDEVIEVTGIHSATGSLGDTLITTAPFRSPHHTASYVSIVGGGSWPKPGEITLAHRGVLFMDEFPEFDKKVIEAMRQPLEDRIVTVARARGSTTFPAEFILIAAMNPCPCGNRGAKNRKCVCSPVNLINYQRKISGPIIDRIDLWIEVPNVDHTKLAEIENDSETSKVVRDRVIAARNRQKERFTSPRSNDSSTQNARGTQVTSSRETTTFTPNEEQGQQPTIKTNSAMSVKELHQWCPLSESTTKLLNQSAERLQLSARAYHRVIKIARTIADLDNSDQITDQHLLEALQYRPKPVE